jgi:hypothetical protein
MLWSPFRVQSLAEKKKKKTTDRPTDYLNLDRDCRSKSTVLQSKDLLVVGDLTGLLKKVSPHFCYPFVIGIVGNLILSTLLW